MSGFLFDEIVFGPVRSRRFGVSLGINLLPETMKYCSFNCIYCECGLTAPDQEKHARLFSTEKVITALEERFKILKQQGLEPDNITFAGNGEPTMHPGFNDIIDKTVELRAAYFPKAGITVLSNATRLHIPSVREALRKIDNNVLKLDAGSETMFRLINRPASPVSLHEIVDNLASLGGRLVIQTLFLRGIINNQVVDNTTDEETGLWLGHLMKIKPALVMLYTVSRETPEQNIEKISKTEMQQIAGKLDALHIPNEVF
ncbi:MAG: Fe-S oxidoreductase [Bacteroidetes bacterium]|nr:MAG: Fe-S oxidoreductase [Bacteroidota bacterium]